MKKRSVKIAGHPTSITLEDEFWTELKTIAARDNKSINTLVTEIDETRSGNLSSALRLHVLHNLKQPLN